MFFCGERRPRSYFATRRFESSVAIWPKVVTIAFEHGVPVGDPVEGALILFQGESPAAAEAFARSDPYVKGGLVEKWRVRPWNTVVGEDAAKPTRG